jgi:hypothetical protein
MAGCSHQTPRSTAEPLLRSHWVHSERAAGRPNHWLQLLCAPSAISMRTASVTLCANPRPAAHAPAYPPPTPCTAFMPCTPSQRPAGSHVVAARAGRLLADTRMRRPPPAHDEPALPPAPLSATMRRP